MPVFEIVLGGGGEAELGAMMAHLAACDNDTDRKHVYLSLGALPTAALKRRVLDWATSGEVKLQDFFYPIGSVSQSSAEGLDLAWAYFQEHFERLTGMLAKSVSWLTDALVLNSVSGFATAAKADEVAAFFEAHPVPQSSRKIAQAVENIRTSAAYCDRLASANVAAIVAALA